MVLVATAEFVHDEGDVTLELHARVHPDTRHDEACVAPLALCGHRPVHVPHVVAKSALRRRGTGGAGGELARGRPYDVIVLDWGLPDRDGPSVCRVLRASRIVTPVLMLSARESLEDRTTGLNAGADDYLWKTARFDELLTRIHALVRDV
jgi:CheY-like chemotaxis protein